MLKKGQRQAIEVLISGGSVADAGLAGGVSTRTVYRWLQEPQFKKTLATIERASLTQLARGLAELSGKSLSVLEGALDAKELRAVGLHLQNMLKYGELALLEQQVKDLEEKMAAEGWE